MSMQTSVCLCVIKAKSATRMASHCADNVIFNLMKKKEQSTFTIKHE